MDGDEPKRGFLNSVYDLDGAEATQALYAEWAAAYEAEVAQAGYATPGRCADALKDLAEDPSGPVLDLGCGTGLSGQALRLAGFERIDGCDFSEEMLGQARAAGCYRTLWRADLNDPLIDPTTSETPQIANAVACGVFSPGHAPAEAIMRIMELLPSGGAFVFSLNDHALAERVYEARINDAVDGGWARVAFKEHGPHLPAKELEATVYGLVRT